MDMWNYGRPALKPLLESYAVSDDLWTTSEPHLTPYPEAMLTPSRGAAALMRLYKEPQEPM